jgi:hypothetical protein
MDQANIKRILSDVASELSMQGFALEHEVALRGEWEEAKVDKSLLYATAAKLQEQIAALLMAAGNID